MDKRSKRRSRKNSKKADKKEVKEIRIIWANNPSKHVKLLGLNVNKFLITQ